MLKQRKPGSARTRIVGAMMYKGDPLAGLGKDISSTYTDPVRPWQTGALGGPKDVGTYTDPVRPGMGAPVRGRGGRPMPRDFVRPPTIGGVGLQRPAYTRRPMRPVVDYYPRDPQR